MRILTKLLSRLSQLADVLLTDPQDAQVLSYDAASEKWINADASGGVTNPLTEDLALNEHSLTGTLRVVTDNEYSAGVFSIPTAHWNMGIDFRDEHYNLFANWGTYWNSGTQQHNMFFLYGSPINDTVCEFGVDGGKRFKFNNPTDDGTTPFQFKGGLRWEDLATADAQDGRTIYVDEDGFLKLSSQGS